MELEGSRSQGAHGASSPPTLATDEPEAYIARDRRRALADRVEMPDRVEGSALFADISGFTPLTEALATELGPQRGAEELTANLGRVFHAVIAELDRHGGNVIYFSGDAITCWLDGDDGLARPPRRLRDAGRDGPRGRDHDARRHRRAAGAEGRRRRRRGAPVRRRRPGHPAHRRPRRPRSSTTWPTTEHHAEKGEVVLDRSAVEALGDRVVIGEVRTDDAEPRTRWSRRDGADRASPSRRRSPSPSRSTRSSSGRGCCPPSTSACAPAAASSWPSCGRPIPVFLRFAGIDYDDDDDAIAKLDDFVRRAQQIMAGYGGNVLQLTLGDKGAYLYGVFGSPVAHEDDAARAAAAALELRDLERSTEARGDPDRGDPRSAAERHVRPRDAPHVRVPRRRGEPRRRG